MTLMQVDPKYVVVEVGDKGRSKDNSFQRPLAGCEARRTGGFAASGLALTVAFFTIGGCSDPATSQEAVARLQKVTANAISATGEGADIVISDIRAFPTKREWRAVVDGKSYACDSDELLNLPECRPADPAPAGP